MKLENTNTRSDNILAEFLSLVQDEQYAPKTVSIAHLAYKDASGKWCTYAARATILNVATEIRKFSLETVSLKCEVFELESIGTSLSEYISLSANGVLKSPSGDVRIFDETYRPSLHLDPFHHSSPQERSTVLSIYSPLRSNIRFDKNIQLELNAAETPFGSFDELIAFLGLARENADQVSVEFISHCAAVVDLKTSNIRNGHANIEILLAKNLDPKKFRLGVKQFSVADTAPGINANRFSLLGSVFHWTEEETCSRGKTSLSLADDEILQCFVNFNDVNYGHYWLTNPDKTGNPRRSALHCFDARLENLESHLFDLDSDNKAKAFEVGINWLFWLLGFSPVYMDVPNVSTPQDAPDMLLIDNFSNILVVEATVGTINNNDKLTKLFQRTNRLRASCKSTVPVIGEILPLMVTKLSAVDSAPDKQRANELEISVVNSEELRFLLEQTYRVPDANMVFKRFKDSIQKPKEVSL